MFTKLAALMAQLLSSGQIKKNDGTTISPSNGGWYDGQRYLDGKLLGVNEYEPGKFTSNEVNTQSATQQGVTADQFNTYLNNQSKVSATNLVPPTSVPNTTNALAGYTTSLAGSVEKAREAIDTNLKTKQDAAALKMEALKQKETETLGEIKKLTTPFRADLEAKQREDLYVNKNFEENQKLVDELDTLLTEGNNLIKEQQTVTGLAGIRNPRIQKTMSDVAARAGVIEGVINARNGQIAQAYTMIDRSVNAIAQDREDQISYYETVLQLNNRDIGLVSDEQRTIAAEQLNLLKSDYSRATATADYVKELMINPDTALLMGQAGVTLNDSVESINSKLSQAQYVNEVRDMSNKISLEGGVAVVDTKGIPKDELRSFTDTRGQVHYYRIPKSGGTGTATERSISTLSSAITTNNMSFDQIVSMYANQYSLDQIYSAYNASDMGKKYGPPKEAANEIAVLYKVFRGEMSLEDARAMLE